MKFLFLYIPVSLLLSVIIGRVHQAEIKPQDNPETLTFQPAFNVSVGPVNVLSGYSEAGIDFALNHCDNRVTVSTDDGCKVYEADVFMLNGTTWTAVMENGDFVTVNAQTGVTEMRISGEYRCFNPEISKP